MTGNPHVRALIKLVEQQAHSRSTYDVFRDFVEAAALSLSCAVDLATRDSREARYGQILQRYSEQERLAFPQMFGELVMALEADPGDALGQVFGTLELHNKWVGQFFTPDHICRLLADITLVDPEGLREHVAERGFITLMEPAVGAGAMVIAFAQAMRAHGVNYQQHLHVTAVDVDARAVHMAYVQFSLLHIPAIVITGNTITLEEREHWYTPAHVMGLWDDKLRRGYALGSRMDAPMSVPEPAPLPVPDAAQLAYRQMEMFAA